MIFRASLQWQHHELLLLPASTYIPLYVSPKPPGPSLVDRFDCEHEHNIVESENLRVYTNSALQHFANTPGIVFLRKLWTTSIQTCLQEDLHNLLQDNRVGEYLNYGPATLTSMRRQLGPLQRYFVSLEQWFALIHHLCLDRCPLLQFCSYNNATTNQRLQLQTTVYPLLKDTCFRMEQYFHTLQEEHAHLYEAVHHEKFDPNRDSVMHMTQLVTDATEHHSQRAMLRHYYDLLNSCQDVWNHLITMLERLFNILQAALLVREEYFADTYCFMHRWADMGLYSRTPSVPITPGDWETDLVKWNEIPHWSEDTRCMFDKVSTANEAWHQQYELMLHCRTLWIGRKQLEESRQRWGVIHTIRIRWLLISALLAEHCECLENRDMIAIS